MGLGPRTPDPPDVIDVVDAGLGAGVRAVFTRRQPGASRGPYRGLNLALHVGDDPRHVAINRDALAGHLGRVVAFGHQVHGCRAVVVTAEQPDAASGPDGCDVLVAGAGPLAVGVLVADCIPVLLADPDACVVAAAHAGRVGLLAGVIEAAVTAMVDQGASPRRMVAALGPCAGPCCYEVPATMADEAGRRDPLLPSRTTWGTPSLDLRSSARGRLRAAGVTSVKLVGGCTIEDPAWYSYRRARVTGRFAGAVALDG